MGLTKTEMMRRIKSSDTAPELAVRHLLHSLGYRFRLHRADQREAILLRWQGEQLKALIPPLLERWQPILGVQVANWGIKKMKTKWGACSIEARRIWLNLELAKKPVQCLEYIIVHELVHLLERHHGDRFSALMDTYMPTWKSRRAHLAHGPLGHEHWDH